MHVVKSSRIVAILVVAAGLAACAGSAKAPGETGDVAINIAAVSGGPQVVLVRLYGPTTSQPGVPGYIDEVIAAQTVSGSSVFTATFPSVPVGSYQVHAKGYVAFDTLPADYNTAVPTWESAATDPSVTVTGGNTSTTSLFMQEFPVATFSNNAPYVSAISSDVQSVWSATNGGQATSANLSATLIDADSDLTGYAWFDDVGGAFGTQSGTFSGVVPTSNVATTWTPPANFGGTAHLYLEVYDSVFNASRVSVTLSVQQTPGYGVVIVNVGFNNNPMMASPLVANFILDTNGNIIGGGGQIAPGADTLLTISAWDPNGDALSFNFSDSCGGTFGTPTVTGTGTEADPYAAEVIYTAASTPVVGFTTCIATADVLDGKGGELIVNLGITIGLP